MSIDLTCLYALMFHTLNDVHISWFLPDTAVMKFDDVFGIFDKSFFLSRIQNQGFHLSYTALQKVV